MFLHKLFIIALYVIPSDIVKIDCWVSYVIAHNAFNHIILQK